jgi:PEGA domain
MSTQMMSSLLKIALFCVLLTTLASAQMPARPGKLEISSTTKGLKISINGKPRPEVTPVTLVVSPGAYTVKVGDCNDQPVQVSSGETTPVNCPK